MEKRDLIRSIVKVGCGKKVGSGFLLKGGYIVTAWHVVDGGRPHFFVCDNDSCFKEEVKAQERPAFQLPKEQGDLAVYKIEEKGKYEGRYLTLALDKDILCGRAFSTFGFPKGNKKNGNPYHSARLEDNNSANDYGVKKLTLSDPGNVSKGYSGGPVYIPGYGVVGVITQKWEEIAIGLPSSVITGQFPELKPEERFFPVESIDKYRCLVVHCSSESQTRVFFEDELEHGLKTLSLSDKLFLKRYHWGAETTSLEQAAAEASCICLWIDRAADIYQFEKEKWLKDHPLLLVNYGVADKKKLDPLLNAFKPAPCFPHDHYVFGKRPGLHHFKAVEEEYHPNTSDAYVEFLAFLNSEFADYDAKLKELLMEFDFTAGREAIKKARRSGRPFLFHCLEGTRDCGVEVLARHGLNIIIGKEEDARDVNHQVLDWEKHAPASLQELLASLNLSTGNWFTSDGQRVFILKNFIAPGLDADTVEKRIQLANKLIEECGSLNVPENWSGKLHFFLMNSDITGHPLYGRLAHSFENCYITPAEAVSLKDDPEPVEQFPKELTRQGVPGILRQKLEGHLPTSEDCPYVGGFLLKVCDLSDASHIYHQELTRL